MKMLNVFLFFLLFIYGIGCDKTDSLRDTADLPKQKEKLYVKFKPRSLKRNLSEKIEPMNKANPNIRKTIKSSMGGSQLVWKTPEEWNEINGSGMRLATFHSKDEENKIECSIVSLGGQAGGIKANITRWLAQIELNVSSENLDKFIQGLEIIQTQGQLSATIIDLSKLQSSTVPDALSMYAAILPSAETTTFIKMKGTFEAVNQNQNKFHELVKSFEMR